jgi:hypothetical protein
MTNPGRNHRLDVYPSKELLDELDDWRGFQRPPLNRAEAVRVILQERFERDRAARERREAKR